MVVKRRRPKPLLIVIILGIVMIIMALVWIFLSSPTDRKSDTEIKVEIKSGTSTQQIAHMLKEKDLIRSELLFQIHVKIYNTPSLKADTYIFKKNMNLDKIVKLLGEGSKYNPDLVKLTFKEGENIVDFAKVISENTNNTNEEVMLIMKDRTYATNLISKYWFLTDNILNEAIYYPLEGYLAPNTYHFDNKDVEIKDIIEDMLEQTEKNLEPYKHIIEKDPHHYITMASMVELEGTNTENRKMIVGVFNNRLAKGMNLGSDVTTYYALQHPMTSDLTSAQFATINPYNTRSTTMNGEMPIGPICNPSNSSIEASAEPTPNDDIFFVADKHGNIFYTKTMAEHEQKIKQIKEKGDWIW